MADIVWPVGLPQSPLMRSLVGSYESLTVRTRMDQGPPKVRRRFTRNTRAMRVSFNMSDTELAIFDVFFHDTAEGGAKRYSWVDPFIGDTADFRFVGVPEIRPLTPRTDPSPKFRVEFTVEKLPSIVELADGPPPPPPPPSLYALYVSRFEPLYEPKVDQPDDLSAPFVIPLRGGNGGGGGGLHDSAKKVSDGDNPIGQSLGRMASSGGISSGASGP